MKRIIHTFMAVLFATAVYAEDVLQVVPFKAQPGTTSDEACSFSIVMNNETADIWAFQFDILLPEGMTLDNTGGLDPFELGDRCPYTIGRGGVKNWKHTIQYSFLDDGWCRVVVFTTDADRISGNSGEVLRAYYLTDDGMPEGVHPILIRNSVLTISGTTDLKPDDSSSYCIVGDFSLQAGFADFSSLTGYVPSWVVNSLSDELALAEDFAALDIRNAESFGGSIALPNPNALCYVKHSAVVENIKTGNAVVCGEGYSCEELNLYDGDYCFTSAYNVECLSASYNREFRTGLWSTVVLPLDVNEAQMSALVQSGVTVEKLISYNADNNTLYFEQVECMQANIPYIIKCSNTMAPFTDIEIESFASTVEADGISVDGISMTANYGNSVLNSDSENRYYVFDAANGEFVLVGKNCKVSPFRAYITVPASEAQSKSMSISHIGGDYTLVEGNVAGSTIAEDVYAISGVKVENVNGADVLKKGVYIIGNRKEYLK
ncbi:MAG: hypothetical protein IJF06_06245 [Bacteroidaceae bacterium]|nr:hypothetical protein [Bacteroidaceae bacterium]